MASKIVLVTGAPTHVLASRVLAGLVEADPLIEVRCVVSPSEASRMKELLGTLEPSRAARVTVLEGEAWAMDLGLSGVEWKRLRDEITHVHHVGLLTQAGATREEATRANLDSTREVLELATAAPRLERFVLWSSASVSGQRRGFVLEGELDVEIPARNPVEESLRKAEILVRHAGDGIASTILRPGIVVGDSETGEIDRTNGAYLLVLLMLTAPPDLPMPMPVRGDVPLPLVPVDYVVRAGLRIALDPRSRGRTHHIVDPDPLTASRVFELVAKATGRRLPNPFLPPSIANRLLRLPHLPRTAPVPSPFLDQLETEVVYDDHNARAILAGSGIACPAFEDYVGSLVRFAREQQVRAVSTARLDGPAAARITE